MADRFDTRFDQPQRLVTDVAGRDVAGSDAGLRKHMLSVYNYMASGVLWTGIVALLFASSGYAYQVMAGPGLLKYVIMFSPSGVRDGAELRHPPAQDQHGADALLGFATVMGLSMSTIFLVFTGASIATTFFATAAAFVSLSLWGYTTKRDLSAMGTFLIMGVFGLLFAMIINLFMQSAAMMYAISAIGVLIFAGLTAYDTQRIKSMYFQLQGTEFLGKAAIMGALSLYLDFVNMFTFLLNLMGSRE
jgi:FtsH-binding integral membrane protein